MKNEDFEEILEHLKLLIADSFSAPTDGSKERAEILAQRARGTVAHSIIDRGYSWFTRRKIRRAVEGEITKLTAEVTKNSYRP